MKRSEIKQQIEKLQEQLNNCYPTIEEAVNGDKLEDGWIVVEKYPNAALLAAPDNTKQYFRWKNRNKALEGMPGDCFIPTVKQLKLAYENAKQHFSSDAYWSSTEASSTGAYFVGFGVGVQYSDSKAAMHWVRAFRLVHY